MRLSGGCSGQTRGSSLRSRREAALFFWVVLLRKRVDRPTISGRGRAALYDALRDVDPRFSLHRVSRYLSSAQNRQSCDRGKNHRDELYYRALPPLQALRDPSPPPPFQTKRLHARSGAHPRRGARCCSTKSIATFHFAVSRNCLDSFRAAKGNVVKTMAITSDSSIRYWSRQLTSTAVGVVIIVSRRLYPAIWAGASCSCQSPRL
jgi:hypothetical protein